MKKLLVFVFVFLMTVSFVSALCGEGQININSASKQELMKIVYIGEVRVEDLINLRPFESVDELINIYGIGEKTLNKIKNQGKACVEEEVEEVAPLGVPQIAEYGGKEIIEEPGPEEKEEGEIETITLTAQTIKSPDNKENKGNYALYGFVGFCFLLGILFLLRRKKYKNEFR